MLAPIEAKLAKLSGEGQGDVQGQSEGGADGVWTGIGPDRTRPEWPRGLFHLLLCPHLRLRLRLRCCTSFNISNMADFSGKVFLVTGAAGGLGKAIAESLIVAKAKVVIVDVNTERLKIAESELSLHGDVLALAVDISDEDAVKGMMFATFENFGKLDVVVNNAGIVDMFDGVATLEKSLWDKVIAVNLTAPYLVSKHAVDHFLSRDPPQGAIVNIASVGGLQGGRAG